ncbi:hypothetical protein [Pseudomarimonas salicorniae]|uniref:Uncharacterized protein n=1 Tax=Pseudomarimonas salicorniae TaxID=2933270 RepID=A0ABT0GLB6_9GAMM|nr:hypothetical protein [Lysobacter sp. CAU 1642]MCK7595328.1 hypothetical protein [Lysobacter sp. CAU 1642]
MKGYGMGRCCAANGPVRQLPERRCAMKRSARWVWMGMAALWPLSAAGQGLRTLSVDPQGERVALAGEPSFWAGGKSQYRLFRLAEEGWTEVESISTPVAQTLEFIGDDLLIGGRRMHAVEEDDALEEVGSSDRSGLSALDAMNPIIRGERVLAGLHSFPSSPLHLLQSSQTGWETLAELQAPEALSWMMGGVYADFDANMVAVLLMPMGERCGLLVYEAGGSAWQASGPLFPDLCREGSLAGGGSISIEGGRILIGAYPDAGPEGAPGEAALLERREGEWVETARFQRMTIEGDYTEGGMRPYAFGHRVRLVDSRAHIGSGYQITHSHTASSTRSTVIHNGIFVFVERDGGWMIERHHVHAHPTATFGLDFEVRGNRMFVGSPDEEAAYVFIRGEDGYQLESRLPKEQEASQPTQQAGSDGPETVEEPEPEPEAARGS